MNIKELELARSVRATLGAIQSQKQAEKDAWRQKCVSDPANKKLLSPSDPRGKKTLVKDREHIGRMIVPSRIGSGSRALSNAQKLGVREPGDGIRYPKAGCRSRGAIVTRAKLEKAGFSEDQIISLLKGQAERIRVKRVQVLERLELGSDTLMSFIRLENLLNQGEINDTLRDQLQGE